ncbi:MAG: DUF1273 family protein [Oscillospiraceae bacterium]|nr:DUF1273 family protein [Oscillospiraceae bacterium]
MSETGCCFTGHRHITESEKPQLRSTLNQIIRELVTAGGMNTFYVGGAQGFDTLAAMAVLMARERFPVIRLVIVLPYANHIDLWSAADEVICLAERYYTGCMFVRNRYLVDHSSLCVSYQTKQTGGTAYTVKYASKMGVKVINLADIVKARKGG